MNNAKQSTLNWILRYNRTPYPYSPQKAALKNLDPKQPVYFDGNYPKGLTWKNYQDWASLDENFKSKLIKAWHGDERIEGIGCNAGFNGEFYFSMVDIDRKTFESLEAMEQSVTGWENRNPGMSLCPRVKTQSGGYRYFVGFESVPKDWGNTISFTFTQGGEKSLGEVMTGPGGLGIILGKGLKGEYLWDRNTCGDIPVFPNPESVGLYQVEKAIAPSVASIYDNPDTPEQAREALSFIPINQFDGDYQGWINIGMACHSAGLDFEDWDNWSQGSKSYSNSKDTLNHWKSFKNSGGITVATLFKFAKDNGYKPPRQQQIPLISTSKSNYQTSGNAAFKPEPQSNVLPFQRQQETAKLPPIKEALKSLMERNLNSAELDNEFLELSGIYPRYTKNAIESLYRKLSDESEKQSDKTNQKNNLDKLLRLSQKTLDLSDYLHPNLATPLKNIAEYMGTSQEAILTTLLPTAASLIHLDTQLELIKATNFYANPIIYSGIVAESGSLKSPTQKLITNPLMNLQEIADQDYDLLMQGYQEDFDLYKASLKDRNNAPLAVPIPPKRREYFVVDVTSEAVAGVQADQPDRGFVGFQDELKALISSQNAYRGGRGSDAEKLLSGRDGSGIKVNRAGGKRLFCKRSGYSITGGIQPDVLRSLMGSFDDPNGFWARFIWCILPVAPSRYPENAASFDVNALLLDIYKKIENETPQIHKLSSEAKELYKAWYNQLDDLKLKEVRQGLRAVYSKMKGVTGEFALILHRTNAAVDGCQPDEYISKDAMAKAIKLSKFYISQIKLIHAEGEASQGEIAPQLKKLYDFALSQVSWLTASDIKKGCRLFKKSNPEDIRQSCLDLAEMGYGSTEGEGKSLKYCADIQRLTNINNLSTSTKKPETPINNGLQEFTQIIEVDKVDKKLTECQPSKIPINNGLQPLDDVKVDKLTHNTTDKNKNHNQLDENTDLLTERQPCQLSPSNPDIITVDTPSTSVNFASTLSTFSERPTAPTPTDYRPTQQELVNSQPLPPLIDLAKLIPFDSLYKGETIYDGNHTPYTLKQLVDGVWECTNGRFISPSNISSFHRAPKTAWD
jgi:hypothetical protein